MCSVGREGTVLALVVHDLCLCHGAGLSMVLVRFRSERHGKDMYFTQQAH